MIESEINLIADKLGMTVAQIYNLNLQVQTLNAVEGIITVVFGCIVCCVAYKVLYNASRRERYQEIAEPIDILCSVCLAMFVGLVAVIIFYFTVCYLILDPLFAPEWCAMKMTMQQISGLIP